MLTATLRCLVFVVATLTGFAALALQPVAAQNASPVALDDTYVVEAGQTLSVNAPGILDNDYDPNGDAITVVGFGSLTNGQALVSANGEFSYTPNPGFSGTDSFVYTIQDINGARIQGTVTIEVQPDPNRPPVAGDDNYIIPTGQTLTVEAPGIIANDRDPDGDDVYSASFGSASNGSVSLNTAGRITYTPNAGFTGTDSFTYTLRDGNGGSDGGLVTITVTPDPNRNPNAVDDTYAVVAGQTLAVAAPGIIGNDTDPDGDDVYSASFGRPDHGIVSLNTAGKFSYTPNAGFSGTDSFTYTLRDGNGGSDGGVVTIEVVPTSRTAVLTSPDRYRTRIGTQLVIDAPGLLGNDISPSGANFAAISSSSPANGSTTLFTNGQLEYTPDLGFTGTDSFSYTVRDANGNRSSASVTIVVSNPNRAPIAVDDLYLVFADETFDVNAPGIIGNDTDPDGDNVYAASFGQPSSGTVTSLNTGGAFTYAPGARFTGTTSFSYTLRDDPGVGDGGIVTLEVLPAANRAPVALPDRYAVWQDRTLTIEAPGILKNDYDPDGDDFYAASFGNASNGSVSLNTGGRITYTPNAGFIGTDSFTYTMGDGNGESSSSFVEIVVASDAVLPVELADLDAAADGDRVAVTWQTLSETNNARFEVQRRIEADDPFEVIGTVAGAGTTTETQEYRFDDVLPFTAEGASYRLRQIDVDGTPTLSEPVDVKRGTPAALALIGTAPHPVRHSANVVYTLPQQASVQLEVYDLLGRRVATLLDREQTAGRKTYPLASGRLASGTYVLVLTANGSRRTQRLTVVR